jgi:DNA-binding NtrC family response regulator
MLLAGDFWYGSVSIIEEYNNQRIKIMIVNDEEDILTLYNDYLYSKGHQVVSKYMDANNIMDDIKEHTPDIYLIEL